MRRLSRPSGSCHRRSLTGLADSARVAPQWPQVGQKFEAGSRLLSVGWIGGALAQPDAYSPADHDLSDLGALTANKAWIYNQIGDNLSGILIILLGLGLWRALSPDVLGRIGASAVMLTGLTVFLGAQDEQSLYGRGDNRSAAHFGVRVPPDSRMARRVAAVACGRARGTCLGRAVLWPRQWCVSPRHELDVVRVACLPRCALDANGKCTSSSDRVTESVSIPAFSGRRRQAAPRAVAWRSRASQQRRERVEASGRGLESRCGCKRCASIGLSAAIHCVPA